MIAFRLSLHALKHPFSLLSIALLLLNDHVLKATVPSWLTGKLSDFAGLFFFPILLTTLLAFPLERLRLAPRRIMVASCAITATWFSLIKTVPFANEVTELFATRLLGLPAQIIRDPTDLFALPMIALAWRLWAKMEQTASPRKLGWDAYGLLGVAALATMATAPCPYVPKVTQIEMLSLQAEEIYNQDFPPPPLPKVVCDPADVQHCFRIIGEERVEESLDGGGTWQIGWEVPWGRRRYMDRTTHNRLLSLCGKSEVDMGPYDIAFADDGRLLVAMGTEGLLGRTPEGEWVRESALGNDPAPYTGDISNFISDTLPELVSAVLLAGIVGVALSFATWLRLLSGATANDASENRSTSWAWRPAWLVVVGIVLFLGMFAVSGWQSVLSASRFADWDERFYSVMSGLLFYSAFYLWWLFVPAVFGLGLGLFLTWRRMGQVANQQLLGENARAIWLAVIGIVLVTAVAFELWVLGVIPVYEISLTVTLLLAAALVYRAVRRIFPSSDTKSNMASSPN